MMSFNLVCDRCRTSGAAGEDPFASFAELLAFTPVPKGGSRIKSGMTMGKVMTEALALVSHAQRGNEGFLRNRD